MSAWYLILNTYRKSNRIAINYSIDKVTDMKLNRFSKNYSSGDIIFLQYDRLTVAYSICKVTHFNCSELYFAIKVTDVKLNILT